MRQFFWLARFSLVALWWGTSTTALGVSRPGGLTTETRTPLAPSTSLLSAQELRGGGFGKRGLTRAGATAIAEAEEPKQQGGEATITQLVFNLVKGIVGAGVLTLPSGIAAFGNAPSAVVPALALVTIIGAMSGYGFGLIGRVCALTNTTSYRQAWSESIGSKTSWICAWSCTLKTVSATLAYSMILGDTFTSLLAGAGYNFSRTAVLLATTGGVLLPLCLLKNLSALAPFSLLGSLGMIYTTIAMAIRYFSKAYGPAGALVASVPANFRPSFGKVGAGGALSASTSILVGMLSTAYMAHFNAPRFYSELKNNTVPRYMTLVSISFGISVLLFGAVATLGFLTFGGNASGLILNNYSPNDSLMKIAQIAVAASLVCSYPLAFTGARDGIIDILEKKSNPSLWYGLTFGLLSAITVGALVIPDVSFVLAFAGSTLGNALIYIYPALMWRGVVKKLDNPTAQQKREVLISGAGGVAGLAMGILGAIKAVQSIM